MEGVKFDEVTDGPTAHFERRVFCCVLQKRMMAVGIIKAATNAPGSTDAKIESGSCDANCATNCSACGTDQRERLPSRSS